MRPLVTALLACAALAGCGGDDRARTARARAVAAGTAPTRTAPARPAPTRTVPARTAPTRPAPAPSVAGYAGATNRLCSELVAALRRAFRAAPRDPGAAVARDARDVADAGERFGAATPPPPLARFGTAAARHVAREAATLRRAAALDDGAALGALSNHQGLLPEGIPDAILRRAPACRIDAPAPPGAADVSIAAVPTGAA
jgi:hypothetical protein